MKIIFCLTIVGLLFISCSEDSNSPDEYYKLTLSVFGEGLYEVFPVKDEYKNGESVTITATADTGWKFRKWEGNVTSNANPLQLTMNENKSIQVVFDIPFEPDITGNWESVQYTVDFEIEQPDIFDSTLTGKFFIHLQGATYEYSVSGYNCPPQVRMFCNRQGYYQIEYIGEWANITLINGEIIEAGYHYECDLVKTTDHPMSGNRQQFFPRKVVK
jgi:hypothetical protein